MDFPFIHDPATHKRRPSDQKFMRSFRDGTPSSFFCRITGCEKSVNGHRPGNVTDVRFYDPSIDPRDDSAVADATWASVGYDCGCFVAKGMC